MARDVFRYINDLDEAALNAIAERLEFRGTDATFIGMREAYFGLLELPADPRVVVLGCGTGVEARALARRLGPGGRVLGIDLSPALIERARGLVAQEGLSDKIELRVGDAHALELPDAACDAAIAHTLLSHVADPPAVLRQMQRVVRPGGRVGVFDGDYASLTWGHPDPELGRAMDEAMIATVVNNPRVMREMPRRLKEVGLELLAAPEWVYAEVGAGRFWLGFIDSYGPMVRRSGLLAPEMVDAWVADQHRASQERTFFGACVYYAYVAGKPA
jgi:SAM-dependent methyltransferase